MKIIVTGCAGFIGAECAKTLLDQGHEVIGIDNINDYYDITLKQARLTRLTPYPNFHFHQIDIKDSQKITTLFKTYLPERVLHLAAQAGVRYSMENPHAYVDSNLIGFVNLLEACRHFSVGHFVFASSSSVYGANEKMPYSEKDRVDQPVSLYAATKKSNEALAYSYSHLFQIPMSGLRFFTVYGPWGRPDMSPYKFVHAILSGKTIEVYNQGDHQRDFTFISDIVAGTLATLNHIPASDGVAPYRIFNIGYGKPVSLMRFIEIIEQQLGRPAIKKFLPKQPGDVAATWADVSSLTETVGYKPQISLEEGIPQFVEWYRQFYQ